ncbi:MAG: PAS domain S-box protein, partial [Planctomycetota bacterium]
MKKETIELILKKCLGHKNNETVLIVTDELFRMVARQFYEGITALGVEVTIICMTPRGVNGEEPPAVVARAMKETDIAFLITAKSLSHTQARRSASQSDRRVRIASLPGVDPFRLEKLLHIDYDEMIKHGRRLARLFQQAKKVEIKTEAGTNLSMEINGRIPLIDSGILDQPGSFGNLPAGEVYLAPVEGTAQGIVVIDGSMSGIGKLEQPIKIKIKNGFATEISSPELRKILQSASRPNVTSRRRPSGRASPKAGGSPKQTELLAANGDRSAYNLAELGIGINPQAEVVGNILEDEKAINTVHIALGDNLSLGGLVKAPCHLDGVITNPVIKLDGRILSSNILQGNFSRPGGMVSLSQPLPVSIPLNYIGTELYQTLFNNSNDPQYVVDLKTQVFLEVNQAFVDLSGYQHDEIIGKMKTTDLTPPAVHALLQTKVAARSKDSESDRYEFSVLSKSGQVKPVEISVHKLTVSGREIILGSMRDFSERAALEKVLRDKIIEVAKASNRVMTLTEKIKNVPLFTSSLLEIKNEEELLRRICEMICDRQGIGCLGVSLYLVRGDYLETCYNYACSSTQKIRLGKDHPFARILRGETPPRENGNELIMPIKGRDNKPIGLIHLKLDPKEKELIDDNPTAKKGYQDVLRTLVNSIGLIIENLRLNQKLQIQSVMDELTGVYNRRHFETVLNDEFKRA